jgi:hypothetical protein
MGNAVTTNLVAFAARRAPQRIRLDRDYRKHPCAADEKMAVRWRRHGLKNVFSRLRLPCNVLKEDHKY